MRGRRKAEELFKDCLDNAREQGRSPDGATRIAAALWALAGLGFAALAQKLPDIEEEE